LNYTRAQIPSCPEDSWCAEGRFAAKTEKRKLGMGF
jgi:hypothetical protein